MFTVLTWTAKANKHTRLLWDLAITLLVQAIKQSIAKSDYAIRLAAMNSAHSCRRRRKLQNNRLNVSKIRLQQYIAPRDGFFFPGILAR